jgi:integrase
MRRPIISGMSLHGPGGRKYLNSAERQRFLQALHAVSPEVRLFCLTLTWGGCRISEALALTAAAIDLDAGTAQFETLKRRRRGVVRQVPLPSPLLLELNRRFELRSRQHNPSLAQRRLWSWSRTTAWRRVKEVMVASNACSSAAMPKGLRHTFGVAAFEAVPPHLVQRWLGHASLRTTAIYGDVSGREERSFAARMWKDSSQGRSPTRGYGG